MHRLDRSRVSEVTRFTCHWEGLCRMRFSQGIETEGDGSLLM